MYKFFSLTNPSDYKFLLISYRILTSFSYALWYYFYQPYLKQMGLSVEVVGLAASLFALLFVLSSLPLGWLSDNIGRRRALLILTLFTFIITFALSIKELPLVAVILLLISLSFFFSGIVTISRALAAEVFKMKAPGIGVYYAAVSTASILGPAAGGLVVNSYSYSRLFLFSSIILLLSLLSLSCIKEHSIKINRGKKSMFRSIVLLVSDRNLRIYILGWMIYTIGTEMVVGILPLYAATIIGMDPLTLGFMFSAANIAALVGYVLGGFASDLIGRGKVIALSLLLNALILFSLSMAKDPYAFLALWALASMIFLMHEAPETSYVAEKSPEDLRGSAMGLLGTSTGLVSWISPGISAVLWISLGPAVIFSVMIIISAFGLLLIIKSVWSYK
ncbi:MFS transporter [Pyrobaculum sp.]|uniref:MFS transporter n=1 Tax=Pyrobaculum sp. TaxID=2004705 RepID=UPI003D0E3B63